MFGYDIATGNNIIVVALLGSQHLSVFESTQFEMTRIVVSGVRSSLDKRIRLRQSKIWNTLCKRMSSGGELWESLIQLIQSYNMCVCVLSMCHPATRPRCARNPRFRRLYRVFDHGRLRCRSIRALRASFACWLDIFHNSFLDFSHIFTLVLCKFHQDFMLNQKFAPHLVVKTNGTLWRHGDLHVVRVDFGHLPGLRRVGQHCAHSPERFGKCTEYDFVYMIYGCIKNHLKWLLYICKYTYYMHDIWYMICILRMNYISYCYKMLMLEGSSSINFEFRTTGVENELTVAVKIGHSLTARRSRCMLLKLGL